MLDPYTLDVNTYYTVKLSVINSTSLKSAFVSCQVYVQQSDIMAVISGGLNHVVKVGKYLELDASGTVVLTKIMILMLVYCILGPVSNRFQNIVMHVHMNYQRLLDL
jgi:hypothetical protein